MWPWKKLSPQELAERQLLQQWNQAVRETNLQLATLRLALRALPRSTEEIEAERNAPMVWRQAPHKLLRQIVKKTVSASSASVKKTANWLSRRRCLQPLRVRLVNLVRRSGLKLATLLLRAYRLNLQRSLGSPK